MATRYILHQLVLENFKSYLGKVTVGPFHEHFSAIIGPNGSGKSNLIDAMLFVFGRRASQMRQKNIVGLIHSSSENKPTYARVSVYLKLICGENATCTNMKSEICVSREVEIEGSSRYLLDGHIISHGDLTEFLKSKIGIDLEHNRFLILQGEVEQLSMMPSKSSKAGETGFLEILEDLIGSNKYIDAIEMKEKNSEEACQIVKEKSYKFEICKREKDALEGPCKQASRLVIMQKKLLAAKALLQAKQQVEYEKEVDGHTHTLNEAEMKLDEVKSIRDKIQAQIDNVSDEIFSLKKVNDEVVTRDTKRVRKFQEHATQDSSLMQAKDRLKDRLKIANKDLAVLEKETVRLEEESSQWLIKAAICTKELPTLTDELKQAKKELAIMEDSLKSERSKITIDQLDPTQKCLSDILQVKNELEEEIAKMKAEAAELHRMLHEEEDVYTSMQAKLDQQSASMMSKQSEMNELQSEIVKCRRENVSLNEKSTSVMKIEEDLRNQKLILQQQAHKRPLSNSLMLQLKLYHELKREFQSPGRMHQLGFFLLDLVDNMMTKAEIEEMGAPLTICGLGSDVVIVENSESAGVIVDYVKEKKLGRVECLVKPRLLSRLKSRAMKFKTKLTDISNFPPQSKPAMSILCSEDRLKSANLNMDSDELFTLFYSRVQETLVTSETDPKKIRNIVSAGDRWRVVTMTSQLYEKSGVVGGGAAMNFLIQRQQKLSTEKCNEDQKRQLEITEIDKGITEAVMHRREYNSQLESLESRITRACRALNSLQEIVAKENQLIESLKNQIDKFKSQDKSDDKMKNDGLKRLMKMEQQIKAAELQLQKLGDKENVQRNKLQKIQDTLKSLGGKERSTLEALVNKLEEDFKVSQDCVNNGKINSVKAMKKSELIKEKSIPDKLIEIQQIKNDMEENGQMYEQNLELLCQLEMEKEKLQGELKEIKKLMSNKEREKSEFELSLKSLSQDEIEFRLKIDDSKSIILNLNKQLTASRNQIEHLKADFFDLPDIDPSLVTNDLANNEPIKNEIRVKKEIDADQTMLDDSDDGEDTGIADETTAITTATTATAVLADIEWPDLSSVGEIPLRELQLSLHRAESLANPGKKDELRDITILSKYKSRLETYNEQKEDLHKSQEELDKVFEDLSRLREERRSVFIQGFDQISAKVKELYQMMTMGGDAELEFKDPTDPFKEGIELSVRPPGKSWRVIQNLSGGEKTLSSLSFIFALHSYNPTPIYFLDEIDAALDPNNVVVIASYVSECEHQGAQYVVISLRHQFFERANRLIGVSKVNNETQVCVIDPDNFCTSNNSNLKRLRE